VFYRSHHGSRFGQLNAHNLLKNNVLYFSLKPSTGCGPFRNHTTSYEVVQQLVEGWRDKYEVLHTIIQVISSSGFIAATLVVLL
jgi:hypothetical protein